MWHAVHSCTLPPWRIAAVLLVCSRALRFVLRWLDSDCITGICTMASGVPKPSQAPWVSRVPTTPQEAVTLQMPNALLELQSDMSTALCMLKVQSEQIKLLQNALTVCCDHQEKLLGLFAEGAVKQHGDTVKVEGFPTQVAEKRRFSPPARPLGAHANAAVGSGGLRGTPKPAIGSRFTRGVGAAAKSVAKSASAKPSSKRKVISPLAK
eukprot:6175690-Amphidinium_carterae.1